MKAAKRPLCVVIDTNVVLSALVFGGSRLDTLRLAWQSGRCVPLICAATAKELIRVLAYPKFRLSVEDQHELLADYLPYCTSVNLPTNLPESVQCRDEHDLPFLHLALVGKAKDTLKYSSPRRKPGSSSLNFLDSGFRRNDKFAIDQRLPKYLISGDADLLTLVGSFGCSIVTAEEFIGRCLD